MSQPTASDQQDTVLVVDQDVIVRMNVSEYLRQCGYRVIEAADEDESWLVLKDANIRVDVLFTEIRSQNSGDTFAFAQAVKEQRPTVDVILAGSLEGAAKAAAGICEDGPLEKPFHPETLVQRIRRLKAARKRIVAR
jgi:DNA-binding NtrC family response regulator